MNRRRHLSASVAGMIVCSCLSVTHATEPDWFVNAGANGSNNGTSWLNAFTELQSALAVAAPGQIIWVARGTYTPDYDVLLQQHTGDTSMHFGLLSYVEIYGGFVGTEAERNQRNPSVHETILSGDIGVPGDPSDNSVSVVVDDTGLPYGHLDGFSIRNAASHAIYCNASSPQLAHLRVCSNQSWDDGAGLLCENPNYLPGVQVHHCTFTDNTTNAKGGAVEKGKGGQAYLLGQKGEKGKRGSEGKKGVRLTY